MAYRLKQVDSEYIQTQQQKEKDTIKYPECFSKEVDVDKVSLPLIQEWIKEKINEQLPDDDVVFDYACELLEVEKKPDIRLIHLQMREFLGNKEALSFCRDLWTLLLSAQEDPDGIPASMLEKKEAEIQQAERREQGRQGPVGRTNYNRSITSKHERQPSPWYHRTAAHRKRGLSKARGYQLGKYNLKSRRSERTL